MLVKKKKYCFVIILTEDHIYCTRNLYGRDALILGLGREKTSQVFGIHGTIY